MKFYFIYGNHNNIVLEDYLILLRHHFHDAGHILNAEKDIVHGAINILLENFDDNFKRKVIESSQKYNTQFIIICTEFITGNTFNHFSNKKFHFISFNELLLTPLSVFVKLFIILLPTGLYLKTTILKKILYSTFGSNHYEKITYWKRRFKNLVAILKHTNNIWLVSESQMEGYKKKFPDKKIILFKHSFLKSYQPLIHLKDSAKDIDFLFSGTLTEYRNKILNQFKNKGYCVKTIPASTPTLLRNEYISRAKICLNIRQSANWRYASTQRYFYHIINQSLLISEKCTEGSELDDYIIIVKPEKFITECIKYLQKGTYTEIANQNYLKFKENAYVKDYSNSMLGETISHLRMN